MAEHESGLIFDPRAIGVHVGFPACFGAVGGGDDAPLAGGVEGFD
ncbi:MAG: hypothetical protein AB7P69_03765 [Candidatus Binatia bacterium]